jgi:hypothetical protein
MFDQNIKRDALGVLHVAGATLPVSLARGGHIL